MYFIPELFQGRVVHVRTRNDGMYEGVFCTLSPKAAFVLKCVHKLEKKTANGFNGVSYTSAIVNCYCYCKLLLVLLL